MGGGHGHGHHSIKIPDWRIYKVEDAPELLQVQHALAQRGLKDPWLRNEVWRFNPKEFGTLAQRTRLFFLRGFGLGFAAFVVTICGEKLWEKTHPSEDHSNGHGH